MEEQARADVTAFMEAMAEPPAGEKKKGKAPKQPEVPMPRSVRPEETLVPPQEDDTEARASILRKIQAYEREFGDRLGDIKTAKSFTAKANLDELKVRLADIEHELGKQGAFDIVRQGYVQLCKGIESFQERSHVLPYNLKNFGEAGLISASEFSLPDGSVQKGSMIPLLKEFSIKYSDWFSQRVEMRILIQMVGMMAEVHRINTQAPEVAESAQKKKTSAKTSAAAKNL
jgi:hypothetical protein